MCEFIEAYGFLWHSVLLICTITKDLRQCFHYNQSWWPERQACACLLWLKFFGWKRGSLVWKLTIIRIDWHIFDRHEVRGRTSFTNMMLISSFFQSCWNKQVGTFRTIIYSFWYSHVHDSLDEVVFKILKKPFIVPKEKICHMKSKLIFKRMKHFFFFLKNTITKTKSVIFQLLQYLWNIFQSLQHVHLCRD